MKQQRILAGQTIDAWFGVNVTGSLSYKIATRKGGEGVALWWIKYPLGSTEQLGIKLGTGTIPIPISWWKGVVSAKLRASASTESILFLAENAQIDKSVSLSW